MQELEILYEGTKLQAVWHAAQASEAVATIVMCHGFRGSKDGGGRAVSLAQKIVDRFNVLRFDFLPLSTLSSQVQQLNSVLTYCQKINQGKIILLGRSMGGATSLIAANGRRDLAGIIFWATPVDVLETFTNALSAENMLKLQNNETIKLDDDWGRAELKPYFYQDLLKYDLTECVKNLPAIPKLFVHGELDEVVPVWQGKTAFFLASEPKELCLIAGGDHRFSIGSEQAIQAVYEWLNKYF